MKWGTQGTVKTYEERLSELKTAARQSGLTDEEINATLQDSLSYIRKRRKIKIQEQKARQIFGLTVSQFLVACFFTAFACSFAYHFQVHKVVSNIVERNIQGVIYPFMKLYRKLTLPLVEYFPTVSSLYDESCLIENPYFHVADMECWPCESARVVLNLTDSVTKAHVGLPFIMKTSNPNVYFSDLRETYLSHKTVIDKNAGWISSDVGLRTTSQLFSRPTLGNTNAHYSWRINRMEVGRVLRHLLPPPSPSETPPHASSMGIERFLLIDGPEALGYALPSTEGANVFVKQLSGERMLVLDPTPECSGKCRRLSVLLGPQHICKWSGVILLKYGIIGGIGGRAVSLFSTAPHGALRSLDQLLRRVFFSIRCRRRTLLDYRVCANGGPRVEVMKS